MDVTIFCRLIPIFSKLNGKKLIDINVVHNKQKKKKHCKYSMYKTGASAIAQII